MNTFHESFGLKIEVKPENPDNELSNRYIDVDRDSLSVTSSGTRLFLSLLAALMDSRFATVAIDEPELGLSPPLQRRRSEIPVRGQRKAGLSPHTSGFCRRPQNGIVQDGFAQITAKTASPQEIEQKLLGPMRQVMVNVTNRAPGSVSPSEKLPGGLIARRTLHCKPRSCASIYARISYCKAGP
jgi:hypothetical protein